MSARQYMPGVSAAGHVTADGGQWHPGQIDGCVKCGDSTEQVRRAMVPQMPAALRARVADGEKVWTTDEMRAEFDVIGFAAPLIVVRRKSDGQRGSLMFTHTPRFYFGWQKDHR